MKSVTVFAPATVANVAVGFDILGFALAGVGDSITVRQTAEKGVRIVPGKPGIETPLDPAKNCATVGILKLAEDLALGFGFEVTIEKGIPIGSGMGGSAASAVGGIVAANALLDTPLSKEKLFPYVLMGEKLVVGTAHADNVAACLFGGLTLVHSMEPPDVLSLPVPSSVLCVLVHPDLRIDTKEARAVLKKDVPLVLHVKQAAQLAAFVSGCYRNDTSVIGRCLEDVIIEPQRAPLVPGFLEAKEKALREGALGCSLSGSGPSIFAWTTSRESAERVSGAIEGTFTARGIGCQSWISPISREGARAR